MIPMRGKALLAALAITAALPGLAQAAAPSQAPLCESCHGTGGVSGSPTIPTIAGQKQGYLMSALQDYKDHKRQGASADMMTGIATQLSAADIQALAAYYAGLKAN